MTINDIHLYINLLGTYLCVGCMVCIQVCFRELTYFPVLFSSLAHQLSVSVPLSLSLCFCPSLCMCLCLSSSLCLSFFLFLTSLSLPSHFDFHSLSNGAVIIRIMTSLILFLYSDTLS